MAFHPYHRQCTEIHYDKLHPVWLQNDGGIVVMVIHLLKRHLCSSSSDFSIISKSSLISVFTIGSNDVLVGAFIFIQQLVIRPRIAFHHRDHRLSDQAVDIELTFASIFQVFFTQTHFVATWYSSSESNICHRWARWNKEVWYFQRNIIWNINKLCIQQEQ